jgi:hypothetical protein
MTYEPFAPYVINRETARQGQINVEAWRTWLARYNIDIDDTYQVTVYETHCEVYCYALDQDGQKFVDTETRDAATLNPITVEYHNTKPPRLDPPGTHS